MANPNGTNWMPAIFAGALLLVGALSSALWGPSGQDVKRPEEGPYMNSLDGVMNRHGTPVTRDLLLAAKEAGVDVDAEEGTPTPGGKRAPRPPHPMAKSEMGKLFLQLMSDPDVAALALSHPEGSFIYSRKRGWMQLVGERWEPIPRSKLPPDLRTRYPGGVYNDVASTPGGSVPGSIAGASAQGDEPSGGRPGGEASSLPGTGESLLPVSSEDAKVALIPAPALNSSLR